MMNLTLVLFANERNININFNDLSISQLINITSKITKRNILITKKVEGKVDFVSNSPLNKEELLALLIKVLESKNFTLIEDGNLLKIVPHLKTKSRIVDKNKISKKTEVFTEVVKLKYTQSKRVELLLSKLILQFKDKPFLSYDYESNLIIIIASKKNIKTIKDLINKIDIKKTQIYVEARIIEISEVKTRNLGIKYGFGAGKLSGSSLFTFASSLNEGQSVVLDSAIKDFTPFGISSVFALGAAINLLKENLALEIISEPSILCIDNKESSIYVGETRSIKTGTTTTSGGNISDSYVREDIGLKLKVKPRVLDNEILLDIETILEDIKQSNTQSGNPVTLKKQIKTTAIVKDGESVILGGLIKNKFDTTSEDIPFFSDIPLFGNLFKNKTRIKDKINLVLIITPHIIHENENLTFIRQKLAQFKLMEDKYTQIIKESLLKKEMELKK